MAISTNIFKERLDTVGCDIHFFIEKLNDKGEWHSLIEWKKPKNPRDDDDNDYGYDWNIQPVNWEDCHILRNYGLFGVLARGVRYECEHSLEPRGLPNDACLNTLAYHKDWALDAHTESYITLPEIKELLMKYHLLNSVNGTDEDYVHRGLNNAYSMFPETDEPEKYRAVFWFDN